ncbi:MAG: PrgI family protein [bacterium]
MRFTLPQFIEHEAKIIGPLTFKQVLFFTAPLAADFIFYFSFGKKYPLLFWLLAIVLVAIGGIFAFAKPGGRDMITFIGNLLKFSISPKMYIWKRKGQADLTFKKEETKKDEAAAGSRPKPSGQSHLSRLVVKVETKK